LSGFACGLGRCQNILERKQGRKQGRKEGSKEGRKIRKTAHQLGLNFLTFGAILDAVLAHNMKNEFKVDST